MGLDPTIITAVISELEGSGQIGSESTRYEKIGYVTDAETSLEYSGDLVGLKVEDYCQGRRFAVADIPRPNLENGTALFMGVSDDGEYQIAYSDYYGALDKPALLITGEIIIPMAPEACAIDPRIDTLMYLYETTSDNIGLGLTFEKGWYALNLAKEILIPLDLSKTPVRFYDEVLTMLFKDEYIPVLEQHFPDKRETITYVVKPENVAEVYDPDFAEELRTNWYTISPFNIAGLVDACMNPALLNFGASAIYSEGALRYTHSISSMTTFYKPVTEVKPIEGKYLFPHFNLVEMGLAPVAPGNSASVRCDTTELIEAMKNGPITVEFDVGAEGITMRAKETLINAGIDDLYTYQASNVTILGDVLLVTLIAQPGKVTLDSIVLGGGSSINLPNAEEASF